MALPEALPVLLLAAVLAPALCQYLPTWDSLDSRPLPQWYDQAKFGIFIHWGLYAVPSYGGDRSAAEWFWDNWEDPSRHQPWIAEFMERNYLASFTYPDFAPSFKAELFDPKQWVGLIEKAGAKYVVFTSKHHEGWTNWPSKASWVWNSVDTGPKRDLVGELASAVQSSSSLKFGVYFSLFEWFNPLYLKDKESGFHTQTYVKEVISVQLEELVTQYKPDLIWGDGDWQGNSTYWNSTHFLAWLYNESPVRETIVVNDRWGSDCGCKHGGYFTCLKWKNDLLLHTHKWEEYYSTMAGTWGYRRESHLNKYRSIEDLLTQLITAISRGGNFLLNIGPGHDGTVAPIMQERLLQLGSWLEINGEAVYGSTYWVYQNDTLNPSVWYTTNPESKAVYGFLLQWPNSTSSTVTIGAVEPSSTTKVLLLGYGEVKWTATSDQLVLALPLLSLDSPLRWAWTFKFTDVNFL